MLEPSDATEPSDLMLVSPATDGGGGGGDGALLSVVVAADCEKAASDSSLYHAPKLIHQPPSVLVKPNEPHTIECPIESQPTAEVRWFKDDQLLTSQAPRLEQMGSELLFIQMIDDDTGDYYCEARNYLGSVTSDQFRLTVQSSIHEPRIRFEPRVAEVSPDQQVEFTCTIPGANAAAADDNNGRGDQQRYSPQQTRGNARKKQQRRPPEVSWKRNGRRLPVKWLDSSEVVVPDSGKSGRFVARLGAGSGDYVLTITRALVKDDNSTFTCLYRSHATVDSEEDEDSSAQGNEELLRESSPVRLRVLREGDNYVKLDVDLAPPIENLDTAGIPNEIARHNNNNNNHTTQLLEPRSRGVSSLRETLMDLYEIVKPALVVVGLVSLVAMFIILQFVIIRGRNRQNRYMKHQYSSAGSGSSSGAGSAAGGASSSIDCDPVLNSLMARTLSAPSAASLSGAGKKFRSYRDHMRKVAAAGDLVGSDLVDGYFRQQQQQPQFNIPQHLVTHQHDQEPFFASAALGPANLYNQSLAAREQARNLLQTSDHMRSLSSNLNQCHKLSQPGQPNLRFSQNGSHLNLPLSFAFGGTNRQLPASGGADGSSASSSQLMANALWQPHLAAMMQQQQQHSNHKSHDEHYQLVNCSSISPSSTSSAVGGGSSSNSSNQQQQRQTGSQRDSRDFSDHQQQQQLAKETQNHYSIIENNDDEDRYEEVDQCRASSKHQTFQQQQQQQQQRTSTFVLDHHQQQPTEESLTKSSLRSSLKSDSSSSWQGADPGTSGPMFDMALNRSKRKQQDKPAKLRAPHQDTSSSRTYQDQLSPYAVSSICGSIPPPPSPPQPPPVNSEAMKALTEQFDINQLMLLDESINNNQTLSFNAPPPPPLPNSNG